MKYSFMLFCLFSCTKTMGPCATPADFNIHNPNITNSLPPDLKKQNDNGTMLHQVMIDNSIPIGSGGFGEVFLYNHGGKIYVIKKIVSKKFTHLTYIEKEIEIEKYICEIDPNADKNTLQEYYLNIIPGIFACVQDLMIFYIFMEQMFKDFQSEHYVKAYSDLRGRQKADIMMQIISKFQKIHDKYIVHADIKPNNLMTKGNDFDDIRIIDFGMSDYLGKNFRGGTPFYAAPEYSKRGSRLSFQGDVYSLAVTFAMMEISTHKLLHSKLDKKCRDYSKPPTKDCVNKFRSIILSSFNQDNETLQLATVMIEALDVDPKKRIKSMKVFKEKILNAYLKLPDPKFPRVQNPTGCLGCIKRLFKIGNRPQQRILSSSSNNEFSTVFANRILAEEEAFGSKMVI